MNILRTLGLMKRSEHEAVAKANKGLLRDIIAERQKFNMAIGDLSAALFENEALRHDAQKWRDKLARDRAARKGAEK